MNSVKEISRPDLKGARKLTSLELNKIRFSSKHTVLTPELLEARRGQVSVSAPQAK